ncbi:MAG: SdrD B-like domain-containing protein [Anaerolineae bacterium]
MTSHQTRCGLRVRWLLSTMLSMLLLMGLMPAPTVWVEAAWVETALQPTVAGVSGHVWHDWDHDGMYDEGEPPLEGVLLALADPHGTLIASTLTDAAGLYRFEGLLPGSYLLSETDLDGFTSTTPNLVALELVSGSEMIQDFGDVLSLPGCFRLIDGQAWHDVNGNRRIDADEPALAGVSIRVLNLEGQVVGITLTDAFGMYTVRNLPEGQYLVIADPPAGYASATVPLHWGVDLRGCYPAVIDLGFQRTIEVAWAPKHAQDVVCRCGDLVAPDGEVDAAVEVRLNPPAGEAMRVTGLRVDAQQGSRLAVWDTDPQTKDCTLAVTNADGTLLNPHTTLLRTVREAELWRIYLSDDAASPLLVAGTLITVTTLVEGEPTWQATLTIPASETQIQTPESGDCPGPGMSVLGGMVRSVPWAGAGAEHATPLADVLVILKNPQGQVVAQQRTDTSGHYRFEGLLWQHYYVVQQPLPSYEPVFSWLWGAASTDASEIVINLESIPAPELSPMYTIYLPHVTYPPAP